MLTTAIPTVLAHAAHAAHAGHTDHGTPNLPAFLAFAIAPALLVFAALLVRKRDTITASVCLFSAVAAQLHALVTGEHIQEHVAFGAFFMVVTLLQIAWIVAAICRPSTETLAAGVGLNLVVLAVWAASRTTGLPIGPDHWTAESVGVLDLASGACEAAVVAGCLWLARTAPAPARRPVPAAAVS
jgi:hypothetical protein